jgi:hypothetical protein
LKNIAGFGFLFAAWNWIKEKMVKMQSCESNKPSETVDEAVAT